jgi:hypothetical protein
MKVYTNTNSSFPSQVVSDAEKASYDYGLQVSRAIEQEWFDQGRTNQNRYQTNWNNFHQLRLYARGEQSIQKYKDELSINGDLSYLNLDWKPVPVISKFVDIVVNGISQKTYDIKAFAQDPESLKKRTDYATGLIKDMYGKNIINRVKTATGIDVSQTNIPTNQLPETIEEVEMHMQLSYKQSVEIAEEEAINNVLAKNKYDETRKRLNHDLTVIGISSVKTNFNVSNGITIDSSLLGLLIY